MHLLLRTAAVGIAMFAMMFATPVPVRAQTGGTSSHAQTNWKPSHRIVVQVTQNDPQVMNMALNNVENLVKYYESKGEKVEIEFVAYGPGLNMVRSDTSPVKDRLSAISGRMKNVTFSGCGNTLSAQSKQENKEITLLPEARLVPTGIARIVELQEQGWTYVRP